MSFHRYKIDISPAQPDFWELILYRQGIQDFLRQRALTKDQAEREKLKAEFIQKVRAAQSNESPPEGTPSLEDAIKRWIGIYANRAREWKVGSLQLGEKPSQFSGKPSDVEIAFETALSEFLAAGQDSKSLPENSSTTPNAQRHWILSNCGHKAQIHARTLERLQNSLLESSDTSLILDSHLSVHQVKYDPKAGLSAELSSPGMLHTQNETARLSDTRCHFHNCRTTVRAQARFAENTPPTSDVEAEFAMVQVAATQDQGVAALRGQLTAQKSLTKKSSEHKTLQLSHQTPKIPLKEVTPIVSLDIDSTSFHGSDGLNQELLTIIYFCYGMGIPCEWNTLRTIAVSKREMLGATGSELALMAGAAAKGKQKVYEQSLCFFRDLLNQQGIFDPIINTPLDKAFSYKDRPYIWTLLKAEKSFMTHMHFNRDGIYDSHKSRPSIEKFDEEWKECFARELAGMTHTNNKAQQIKLSVARQRQRYGLNDDDFIELHHVDDDKRICDNPPKEEFSSQVKVTSSLFNPNTVKEVLVKLADLTGLDMYANRLWRTGKFQDTKPRLADLAAVRYLIQTQNKPEDRPRLEEILRGFFHKHYLRLRPAQQRSLDALVETILAKKPVAITGKTEDLVTFYQINYTSADKTTQRLMNHWINQAKEPERSQCLHLAVKQANLGVRFKNAIRSFFSCRSFTGDIAELVTGDDSPKAPVIQPLPPSGDKEKTHSSSGSIRRGMNLAPIDTQNLKKALEEKEEVYSPFADGAEDQRQSPAHPSPPHSPRVTASPGRSPLPSSRVSEKAKIKTVEAPVTSSNQSQFTRETCVKEILANDRKYMALLRARKQLDQSKATKTANTGDSAPSMTAPSA